MKSCSMPDVNGPLVESPVWDRLAAILADPEVFMAEMQQRQADQQAAGPTFPQQLYDLENKLRKVDAMDTELVAMKLRGEINQVVYDRNLALNRAERTHVKEEVGRLQATIAAHEEAKEATASLITLHSQVKDRLETSTPEERRWLLQTLDVRVTANEGEFSLALGVPPQFLDSTFCSTDRGL